MIPLPDAATAPRSPPHVLVWDLDALMLAPSLTELLAPWSGAGVGDGRGSDAGDGDGLAVGGAAAASGSAAAVMVDMFDGDEEEFQEHRKIVSVDWANRKGHQVVTNLIGSEDDPDLNEGYLINESLPLLIKAGKMSACTRMRAAATAVQPPYRFLTLALSDSWSACSHLQ